MQTIRGTPARGLAGATLGFFIGFAAVALFGPTARRFGEILHLGPLALGFLVAMPALSGSLLRVPFAAWVDVTGGRKPFLVLLGTSIAGMAGLTALVIGLDPARAPTLFRTLLFTLGVVSGAGIATFSVGISQVSYWFPQARQGRALAVFGGVGNLAPGLFSLLLPLALAGIGLQASYAAWLGLLVVGTVLYHRVGRNSPYFQLREAGMPEAEARRRAREEHGQEILPTGSVRASLMVSAGIGQTWLLVAIYFATFGGFMALTAWFPTYWHEHWHVATLRAGVLTATYSLLTSLARIPGGSLADRFGGAITLRVALAAMLVGALGLSFAGGFGLALGAVVVLAVGMGVANAAVFKLVPQAVPQAVGGASGWVGGLGALGGFVLPPVLGAIVRAAGAPGYDRGFLVFAGLALGASGLALRLGGRASARPAATLGVAGVR